MKEMQLLKQAILKEATTGKLSLDGVQSLIKNFTKDVLTSVLEREVDAGEKSGRSIVSTKETVSNSTIDHEAKLISYQQEASKFDQCIVYLYASGMTTRDIQEYVYEVFGIKVTQAMISMITDRVMADARKWQQRPLDSVYVTLFFDALPYKVRENGKVVSKAVYSCIGINSTGHKELLGFWITSSEGTTYWFGVLNELKSRGLKDIFIVCSDRLKGLAKAVDIVFPETTFQRSIVHMIRTSLIYLPTKYRKEFSEDLKGVYAALTEEAGQEALESLLSKWEGEYPLATHCWKENWEDLVSFLKYPLEIRKVLYTVNTIESMYRRVKKIIEDRSVLLHDDALFNLLYLAAHAIEKKTYRQVWNWPTIATHLHNIFKARFIVK